LKAIHYKTFVWVTIFAIAMGFLETTVVVYLRELLYPKGFSFPLAQMPKSLIATEIYREAATLVMLLSIGIIAGKSHISRFAWFLYTFAIWDIFYYIFLKLLLHWPETFMTWDILFLIPTIWVGPVLSPIIVSLTMIFLSLIIIQYETRRTKVGLKTFEWLLLISGSLILILAFIWDYSKFILNHLDQEPDFAKISATYIPQKFNWTLFAVGEFLILFAIFLLWKRYWKHEILNTPSKK
jgi:hypothetical protein